MDTAAQNLACGPVLQIFFSRPPPQRSSFLRPRRADRDPFRVFQAWPSETRGSGTILVSGADSLNPWERALKNRGAPAQGKPRGGNSCGAGSETRGVVRWSESGCSEAFASSYRGIEKWLTHQVLTLEIVGSNPTLLQRRHYALFRLRRKREAPL